MKLSIINSFVGTDIYPTNLKFYVDNSKESSISNRVSKAKIVKEF